MSYRQETINRYWKWKQTAKKSAKFKAEGTVYSQKEFETVIGHISAEKTAEPINTTVEQSYGDLEEQERTGDTEES